jgi:hypothetical protein
VNREYDEEKSDYGNIDDNRDDGALGNSVSPAGDRARAAYLP